MFQIMKAGGSLTAKEVQFDDKDVEAVQEVYYLRCGCELDAVSHCKSAWDTFCQLLALPTNHHLPLLTKGP